ncbi:hypothetical protein VNO77_41942 [Canavalia gladiata]|uniref:Uncharacterized protein n=1 Tax=Canavalia gladiata TaxID=3824 RepID=A0AAN9JZS6_CANGL
MPTSEVPWAILSRAQGGDSLIINDCFSLTSVHCACAVHAHYTVLILSLMAATSASSCFKHIIVPASKHEPKLPKSSLVSSYPFSQLGTLYSGYSLNPLEVAQLIGPLFRAFLVIGSENQVMADRADLFLELGSLYRLHGSKANQWSLNVANTKLNSKQTGDSRVSSRLGQNMSGGSAPRPWCFEKSSSNA